MTTYGLTAEGFVIKTLDVIQAEIEAELQTAFGASIDLDPEGPFGQLVGIMAEREALLWELAQDVHAAFDPDTASGTSLEGVSAITGTLREGATRSAVTVTAVGTTGTLLSVGRVVSVVSVGTRFETTEEKTILAVSAWAPTTAYVLGQRVKNSGRVYQCITAGTSAGSGGPTTTAADITDGTAHWKHLGTGDGAVDVAAEAEETGPLVALAGTLTVIETPVGGWSAVLNLLDADLGRDIESDAALRLRRADEVTGQGNATVNAIRRGVLAVDDVEACIVYQNTTLITDADGVPGKAVEVLVQGGDDQAIAEAIFEEVAAGIETFGSTTMTVEDSAGNDHDVSFSRPTDREVYIVATVVKDPDDFPSDGENQLKAALVAYGDLYPIGKDVIANALRVPCFGISGVLNVTVMNIGVAPAPATEATITVTNRQRAVFDTSRISLTLSDGTP